MYKLKVYQGGIVKLPSEVRRRLEIEPGSSLILIVKGDRAVLLPEPNVDPIEALSSALGASIDEDAVIEEGRKRLRRILMARSVEPLTAHGSSRPPSA